MRLLYRLIVPNSALRLNRTRAEVAIDYWEDAFNRMLDGKWFL